MNPVDSHSPLQQRRAGLLLHPTSLPGPWGNGDLGAAAYHLVDWMVESGHTVWQILPLGPTHGDGSPYQCLSAFAGNPELISLERLVQEGWLDGPLNPNPNPGARQPHIARAFARFIAGADQAHRHELAAFRAQQAHWVEDYALYRVLKNLQGGAAWNQWPAPLRDRQSDAIARVAHDHQSAIEQVVFEQFIFFRQWHALRRYANGRGLAIFGDMPIFVAYDSADVWADRASFRLDAHGNPSVVAGVPPDYFSATGQRWGNPHYAWERMQANGFDWWIRRMEGALELFDLVRIDHFRGFEAYWEVPAHEQTAMNGHWVKAPGEALFSRLRELFDPLPVVAEDLGIITPEVEALRRGFSLPGMKILQFAFDGGAKNPYLPHNHEPNGVVYTGTHDNDTILGWFNSLSKAQQGMVCDYLGSDQCHMPWPLIRTAYASVAQLAIVPLQDLLALDGRHRMNTPGTTEGNWRWRFNWEQVPADLASKLNHLLKLYGRV